MALCPAHDNAANRASVADAWQHLLKNDIAEQTRIAQSRTQAAVHRADVRFLAGGMLSFLCQSCAPTPQGTLRIVSPEGEQTFIPMQHVREFSVRPHAEQNESALSARAEGQAIMQARALDQSEEKKKALLSALGANEQDLEKALPGGDQYTRS